MKTLCPHCEKIVIIEESNYKDTLICPHCCNAFKNPQKKEGINASKYASFFVLFIVILSIWGSGARSCDTSNDISNSRQTVKNSVYDASVSQVEQYLKKNLNDPKSYESIEWSQVNKTDDNNNSAYKYWVRHKYRAKNIFGGYVVSNQIFYLDKNGNVIDFKDISY